MKAERKEALIRVPVIIIGWIIMDLWAALVTFVCVVHWAYALVTSERHKGLSKFSNYFIAYMYSFVRYAAFASNKRPFPWEKFPRMVEKVDMRKKQ